MFRWTFLAPLVLLFACSPSPPDAPVVRLVDVFDAAVVEGSSEGNAEIPRTEWRFDGGDHSWKAGPGVEGLTVRDGRLVGRATTEIPILHVERTSGVDDPDTLHAVAARKIDAFVVKVRRERPERLNRVRVQVRSVVVSELGERREVVAIPVSVRDPSHRQQARSLVDTGREVFHRKARTVGACRSEFPTGPRYKAKELAHPSRGG